MLCYIAFSASLSLLTTPRSWPRSMEFAEYLDSVSTALASARRLACHSFACYERDTDTRTIKQNTEPAGIF
jgi:hypothetical protein